MKLFVSAQTRFMTRKTRAVSMLEYVLLAGVVLVLVISLRTILKPQVDALLNRIGDFLGQQG